MIEKYYRETKDYEEWMRPHCYCHINPPCVYCDGSLDDEYEDEFINIGEN